MECINCGKLSNLIAAKLGLCPECIINRPKKVYPIIEEAHRRSRAEFSLPPIPPKEKDGAQCNICVNQCRIPEGKRGYCNLRLNKGGKIVHLAGTKQNGAVDWYFDPLPTNCVASGFCEGTSAYGYNNLAVFYNSCSFDCLFCQNWHFRRYAGKPIKGMSAQELANCVDKNTFCICFFGGDPTTQIYHALETARLARENKEDLRICWETNGTMNLNLLKKAAGLSIDSGGCIKFDLKTFHESLNIALCGVTNKRTLENFKYLTEIGKQRPEPPFLIASTLLVPGYIEEEEVSKIASFIASLDRDIPYVLLGFYPHFYFSDLPRTSRKQSADCYEAARKAGLKKIRIGNVHLLI